MRAGGFAAGSALFEPREVHDYRTEQSLARFRRHMSEGTDAAVLEAAAALERPAARQHPLCAELRQIVDAQLASRGLSLAPLAGGTK